MIRAFTRVAVGFMIAAAATSSTAEDLTIVSKVAVGKGADTTSTQYMTTDKMRTSSGDTDTIVELANGKYIVIDNKKKEYYEMTVDEMNTAFAAMEEKMKAMEAQMKDAPAFLKKAMGGGGPVTVAKGTAHRKIAGYDTEHYVATMGDTNKMEFWVTKEIKPPTQYYNAFKLQFAALGPAGQSIGKAYEEMRKIDGFPLASTTSFKMMGQNLSTSQEATEVKKGAVPATAFAIPAGYKKKDSPLKNLGKK
jgi:hypothetical protein